MFPDAAIWTSDDAATWTRATIDAVPGGTETVARVTDMVALDGSLVAIGSWGAQQSDQFAWAVWRSTDGGATWSEERLEQFAMVAMTLGGPGIVAAGWDYAGVTPFDSWISVSTDGQTWQRVESPAFETTQINAVATLDGRLVAVGADADEAGAYAPAAWLSDDDGQTWTQVSLPGPPGALATAVADVAVVNGALLAVGITGTPPDLSAVAWSSTDGQTWSGELVGEGGARQPQWPRSMPAWWRSAT